MSVAKDATPTSVYLYFDETDVLIYVGVTSRGVRRQREHNSDKEWWRWVARQEVKHFDNRPDALVEEKRLIVKHLPPFNVAHNPTHERSRSAYLGLQAVRAAPMPTVVRRKTRRGLILTPLSEPLPGHVATLCSSPLDGRALIGELVRDRMSATPVSTPTRAKAGRVVDLRYVGGSLLVGVSGKYIPDEITHARAIVSMIKNRKPAGFEVQRVLVNEHLENGSL